MQPYCFVIWHFCHIDHSYSQVTFPAHLCCITAILLCPSIRKLSKPWYLTLQHVFILVGEVTASLTNSTNQCNAFRIKTVFKSFWSSDVSNKQHHLVLKCDLVLVNRSSLALNLINYLKWFPILSNHFRIF